MQYSITRKQNVFVFRVEHFSLETLICDSVVLRNNPLGDPHVRHNPIMIPRGNGKGKGLPVVLVLSGFTGNGTFAPALNRTGEENQLQQIDFLVGSGKAPKAIYVFVDAFTRLGGSQFLDSAATGNYETYIVEELVPAIKKYYPAATNGEKWCVTGTSSGGYGALHLATKFPSLFSYAAALAPDCGFEVCYGYDLICSAQFIEQSGGYKQALKRLSEKSVKRNPKFHSIANGLAMAACYSAVSRKKVLFPVDYKSGELRTKIWKLWKQKDPLEFTKRRRNNLKKMRGIYLAVGKKDEFFLHYGARKLHAQFLKFHIPMAYSEFDGGHFEMAEERQKLYSWLAKKWQ